MPVEGLVALEVFAEFVIRSIQANTDPKKGG